MRRALLALLLGWPSAALAEAPAPATPRPWYAPDPALSAVVAAAVQGRDRAPDEVSVTLVEPGPTPRGAAHLGAVARYPASLVKLFVLAYAYHRERQGALEIGGPLRADLGRMIRVSSNKAARRVIDAVTGTSGTAALEGAALEAVVERRAAVDRWVRSLHPSLAGAVVGNKTWWSMAASPLHHQVVERLGRNQLTSDGAALMLDRIAGGAVGDPPGTAAMLALLRRRPARSVGKGGDRQRTLVGSALPATWSMWNKCGWTRTTCHDVALVERPDGRRFLLAVMVESPEAQRAPCGRVRALARRVVAGLSKLE